jgi:hypothetical protein
MKHNANRIYIAVTAAALVLAAILLLNYEINRRAEESETVKTATTVAEKEKKDKVLISTSSETIRDGLANMGVLITQEYYFTQVETYTKEKNIFLIIPSSSGFMYSYDGAVLAGVDFEKIGVQTDEDRQVVTVDLPPSEIQTVSIDRDTFKIYSEKESIWNPLKLEDYNISLVEFENAARDKAVQNGILERSDAQAENLVRQFIRNFPDMSKYTIEFK